MQIAAELDRVFEPRTATVSGLLFDVMTPEGEVRIGDIAHGLAHLCRFSGQSKRFFSVAEHSVNVHDLIAREYGIGPLSFAGLLHDAAEAYINDMARPVKVHCPEYQQIEDRLQAYIQKALGVQWNAEVAALVKRFDNIALRYEAEQLLHINVVGQWNWGNVEQREMPIQCLEPRIILPIFLTRYRRYRPD